MTIKIDTTDFDYDDLTPMQQEWVYNSLDCAVTAECWENINEFVGDDTRKTYGFVKGLQAPAMNMAIRGISINIKKRNKWIAELSARTHTLSDYLDQLATAVWNQPLNANSPKQMVDFFYGVLNVPEQFKYDSKRKERVVTTDKAALEKLEDYFYARPFVKNILRQRDLNKKIGTLKTGIDSDEKMRTSYNVCGTETGRWSSNSNVFGSGTNLQNITNELREIFVAKEGYKLAYVDLEQAESRVVAYLSGDQNYIDACEGGDLHTTAAQMVWPELGWTGDLKQDKAIAEQRAHGIFSYRDLAKRGGHGTNYMGKPPTMAKHLHTDVKVLEEFQDRYFSAFPGIPRWHQDVATELQTTGKLTTPIGRTRYFLSRLHSDDTLKEGIAFLPQSTIGEILNEGMYRVWKKFDPKEVELLAQVHDAILIQYPDEGDEYETQILKKVMETIQVPLTINGRTLIIPANVEGTGWNWRKYKKNKDGTITNPEGLKEYTGHEERVRKQRKKNTSVLSNLYL